MSEEMPKPKTVAGAETMEQKTPETTAEQTNRRELAILEAKQGLEDYRNGVLKNGKYADMEDLLALARISPRDIGMTEKEAADRGLKMDKIYTVEGLDPMKNDFIPSSDNWD